MNYSLLFTEHVSLQQFCSRHDCEIKGFPKITRQNTTVCLLEMLVWFIHNLCARLLARQHGCRHLVLTQGCGKRYSMSMPQTAVASPGLHIQLAQLCKKLENSRQAAQSQHRNFACVMLDYHRPLWASPRMAPMALSSIECRESRLAAISACVHIEYGSCELHH